MITVTSGRLEREGKEKTNNDLWQILMSPLILFLLALNS